MTENDNLDEDLTPGRTEVDPTSDRYQSNRLKNAKTNVGSGFALKRLNSVANLRRSTTPTSHTGSVPLKLPTPPRDHTYIKPKPLNLKPMTKSLYKEETIAESRKAEIVKTAYKKAKAKKEEDRFEPNPELQSAMTRPQGD